MWRSIYRLAFLAVLSAAVLAISGCDEGRHSKQSTETKEVGEFEAIDFHGAGKLIVTVGQAPALSLTGDASILNDVESEVREGTLYVRYKHRRWDRDWFGPPRNLKVEIAVPRLEVFQASGAGSVHINGLNGGDQRVTIAGAYNIEAKGKLDRLEITLNGAGNIDYDDVVAQNVKVNVNGAGNVDVHPMQALDAQVNGVGAVRYRGEPNKVNSAIHGLGAIERK